MDGRYGQETMDELEQDAQKVKNKLDGVYDKALDKLENYLENNNPFDKKSEDNNDSQNNKDEKEESKNDVQDDSKNTEEPSKTDEKLSDDKKETSNQENSKPENNQENSKEKNKDSTKENNNEDSNKKEEQKESKDEKPSENNEKSSKDAFDNMKNSGGEAKNEAIETGKSLLKGDKENAGEHARNAVEKGKDALNNGVEGLKKGISEKGNDIKNYLNKEGEHAKDVGNELKGVGSSLKNKDMKGAGDHAKNALKKSASHSLDHAKNTLSNVGNKMGGASGVADKVGDAFKNTGRVQNGNASGDVANQMSDAAVDMAKTGVKAGVAAARLLATGGADVKAWIDLAKSGIIKYIVIALILILALPIIVLVVLPGAMLAMAWTKICEAFVAVCEQLNPTKYESFSMEDQYEILAQAFGTEVLRAYGEMKDTIHTSIDTTLADESISQWNILIEKNKDKLKTLNGYKTYHHMFTPEEVDEGGLTTQREVGMPTDEEGNIFKVYIGGYTGDITEWGDAKSKTNDNYNKGLLICEDKTATHLHKEECYAKGDEPYFDELGSREAIDSKAGYAAISDMAYLVAGYNVAMNEAPIIEFGSKVSALEAGANIVKYKFDISSRIFGSTVEEKIENANTGFWLFDTFVGVFEAAVGYVTDKIAEIFGGETSFFTFDGTYNVNSTTKYRTVYEYKEKLYHVVVPKFKYNWQVYYTCNGTVCHSCNGSHTWSYVRSLSSTRRHKGDLRIWYDNKCINYHVHDSYCYEKYEMCTKLFNYWFKNGAEHECTDSCNQNSQNRLLSCGEDRHTTTHNNSCYYWYCNNSSGTKGGCKCTVGSSGHASDSIYECSLEYYETNYDEIKNAYTYNTEYKFKDGNDLIPSTVPYIVQQQIPNGCSYKSAKVVSWYKLDGTTFDLNRSIYEKTKKAYDYYVLETDVKAFDVDRILKALFETSPYYTGYLRKYLIEPYDGYITTEDSVIRTYKGYIDVWKYAAYDKDYDIDGNGTVDYKVKKDDAIMCGIDRQPYINQKLVSTFNHTASCTWDSSAEPVTASDTECPKCHGKIQTSNNIAEVGDGNRPLTYFGTVAVQAGYYFSTFLGTTTKGDIGDIRASKQDMMVAQHIQEITDYVGDAVTHGGFEVTYSRQKITLDDGTIYYPITVYDRVMAVKNTSLKTLSNLEWIEAEMKKNGLEYEINAGKNNEEDIYTNYKENPLIEYMVKILVEDLKNGRVSNIYSTVRTITTGDKTTVMIGLGKWQNDKADTIVAKLSETYDKTLNLYLGGGSKEDFIQNWDNPSDTNYLKMKSALTKVLEAAKIEQVEEVQNDIGEWCKHFANMGYSDGATISFLTLTAMYLDIEGPSDYNRPNISSFRTMASKYKTVSLKDEYLLNGKYEETEFYRWLQTAPEYNSNNYIYKAIYEAIIEDINENTVPSLPTPYLSDEDLYTMVERAKYVIDYAIDNPDGQYLVSTFDPNKVQSVERFMSQLKSVHDTGQGQAVGNAITFINALLLWHGYDAPSTKNDWVNQKIYGKVNASVPQAGDIIIWSAMGNYSVQYCVGDVDGDNKPEIAFFGVGKVSYQDWDYNASSYHGNKSIIRLTEKYVSP